MKKNPISKIAIISFFVLFMSSFAYSQAPNCNYAITNGFTCIINITIDFKDANGVCNSITTNVNPGPAVYFSCLPGCIAANVVDVKINVNSVNSITLTSPCAISLSTPDQTGSIPSSACSGSPGPVHGHWGNTGATISN